MIGSSGVASDQGRVIAIIPARGGSKGVPRKNVRQLGGVPLLRHAVEHALETNCFDRILVSTDDEEIQEVALAAGAEAPFLRPRELARDETPTLPVIQHALRESGEDERCEAVCLLQPTVPFRVAQETIAAVERFVASDADSLVSVREVPHTFHPEWVFRIDGERLTRYLGATELPPRRQELVPTYYRDGNLYITRINTLLCQNSLYGKRVLPFVSSAPEFNIDTQDDWDRAEAFLNQRALSPATNS